MTVQGILVNIDPNGKVSEHLHLALSDINMPGKMVEYHLLPFHAQESLMCELYAENARFMQVLGCRDVFIPKIASNVVLFVSQIVPIPSCSTEGHRYRASLGWSADGFQVHCEGI